MTRREALETVVRGIVADLADYRQMKLLLEAQFEAALAHRSDAITEVGEHIVALAASMEARRVERVRLAGRLAGRVADVGEPASMAGVFALLGEAARARAQAAWRALEVLVVECKTLNARNCRLLMDQHEIMQRVLHKESDIYAPA